MQLSKILDKVAWIDARRQRNEEDRWELTIYLT